MKAHFVTFQSPGTFVHEETTKPIDSWDVEKASQMAKEIAERYNAKPFCFYFTTRERADSDLDSHQVAESGRYFLGGEIETVDQVRARANPEEAILLSNMECNHWARIVTNRNSWRITQPLNDNDTVLEWEVAK